MKLSDVMTLDLKVVRRDANVREAAQKMKLMDIGPIPVVEDGRPVGILTDRDIVLRVVSEGRDPGSTKVGDVMTREIVTCPENDSVEEGARIMADRQIRRILVTDRQGRLAGIVSLGDLATHTDDRGLAGMTLEEISHRKG